MNRSGAALVMMMSADMMMCARDGFACAYATDREA